MSVPQQHTLEPELSIVLPCYRAAAIAEQSVQTIATALSAAQYAWEIVVVDDGGMDFGGPNWSGHPMVRLLQLPHNQGKGAAVRVGMLAARGHVRIFTDVDLPFGVRPFPVMMEYIVNRGFHLVVGDRTMPGSEYAMRIPRRRRLASAVFSSFVGRLVTGGFYDTQCGIKAVRGDIVDALFPLLRLNGFAFDVELIYAALKNRADIKRIPVVLENNLTSSVRLLPDSLQSGMDILRIKSWQARGGYTSEALLRVLATDIDLVARKASAHWENPSARN